MRFLSHTLALSLLLVGCASWAPVQYTPQPVTINDPVADVKGLLTLRAMPTMFGTRPMPALLVEVTEQYVKEVYASGGLLLLNFQQAASFKILHKENDYEAAVKVATETLREFSKKEGYEVIVSEEMLLDPKQPYTGIWKMQIKNTAS